MTRYVEDGSSQRREPEWPMQSRPRADLSPSMIPHKTPETSQWLSFCETAG
jgi:hypothetical protein